jgi:thiamine-phosphate pyrophosphorylase
MNIPPIYPISPSGLKSNHLYAWAKELLDAGGNLIQYREKNPGDSGIFRNAEMLARLFESYSATLVINDRADISLLSGALAIHLGGDDLPAGEVRKLLGENVLIGVSTHSASEAMAAFELPVDYVALGPVFETVSKGNTKPLVAAEVQEKVIKESPLPVVAIGGINVEKASVLWRRGFASVAAIAAFAENPAKNYKEFLKAYACGLSKKMGAARTP